MVRLITHYVILINEILIKEYQILRLGDEVCI